MTIDRKSTLLDLATRLRQYKSVLDVSFIETNSDAHRIFNTLFPKQVYKAGYMLSDLAEEMNVFEPVLEDVLKSFGDDSTPLWRKLTLAIASESGENSVNSSHTIWNNIIERKEAGIRPKFIAIARGLTKIENELLWACFLGHPPITKNKFLTFIIQQQLELDDYKDASDVLSNLLKDGKTHREILKMAMQDKNFYTYSKQKWYESNRDLSRRTFKRWIREQFYTFESKKYQILPKNGITRMKCLNFEERIWIELDDDDKILDVIYFNKPQLTLENRLKKLSKEQEHLKFNHLRDVGDIENFQSLLKYDPEYKDGVIRFPNTNKYNPIEYGGEILVKQSHLYDFRLNRVRKQDGNIILELEGLDGIDFFSVGEITTDRLTDKTVIWDAVKRQMIIENQEDCIIPDSICIVISVSVLSFSEETLPQMIDGYFMSVQYDKGIQEVIQIVDLIA